MPVTRLLLNQLNRPGQTVSVYRTFYPPKHRFPMHRHDFAEMFFIESGRGIQTVEARPGPLRTGDLGFVDPDTAHELAAEDAAAMVLVNLAFSRSLLARLRPLIAARDWPWKPGEVRMRALDEHQQRFVSEWIDRLSAPGAGPTDLAVFVLDLVRRLKVEPLAAPSAPTWLSEAVERLDEPAILSQGVRGLSRRCARGTATVSRAVRRHYGCTAIQLVNRNRMAWFARQLRLTRRPIAELAVECGLPNLSNCYRLFQAAFEASPRRYRLAFQGGVVDDS